MASADSSPSEREKALRDALSALVEASGKIPLAPSQADDETVLAFIRARREAQALLDG